MRLVAKTSRRVGGNAKRAVAHTRGTSVRTDADISVKDPVLLGRLNKGGAHDGPSGGTAPAKFPRFLTSGRVRAHRRHTEAGGRGSGVTETPPVANQGRGEVHRCKISDGAAPEPNTQSGKPRHGLNQAMQPWVQRWPW